MRFVNFEGQRQYSLLIPQFPKYLFYFYNIYLDVKVYSTYNINIKKTILLNTVLKRLHEDDKQGILDVRILLNDNTEIDIEVQLSRLAVWAERSLFYLAKMYADQLKPGDSYHKLKKCVSISILDFSLFHDSDNFYSCFHIAEDSRHTLFTDKMEFHVLELPKLPEELKEDSSDILLWAKFINAEKKEEFDMIAEKNPYIDSAYQKLQVISQDRQKRLEYEAREKAVRDHNAYRYEAEEIGRKKGWTEGHAKGHAEGHAEGRAKGRAKGRAEGLTEGIKAMFSLLMDINTPYAEAIDTIATKFGITADLVETYVNGKNNDKTHCIIWL